MRFPPLYLPALLGACLLLASCEDDDLPVTGVDAETLVEEYNEGLPAAATVADRGFAAVGEVRDVEVHEEADGTESLTFTFDHRKYERTFSFDAVGDIEFPQTIDRAKVVYLGHQMIVVDLNSDFYVHLHVPQADAINLLPGVPYVEGAELAAAPTGDAVR
ncbi:hypothetical protein [Lewinella sp. IMCC34183]|uniref:hypothetical protein n=1 Tax=Lewinella sp. IMCC34183 TaxID=2248762 RepID=UPI000E23C54E|nr:hypothetical protein [Lewinella sp. IMCC34183]